MQIWLALLCIGLLTYATRLSFVLLLDKLTMPVSLQQALSFVPVAVLSAIIFPELFLRNGTFTISFLNFRLLAGIVAILVAWKTRNTLLTITSGMACLWLLQWLVH